jgi:hypothetical protein
LLLFASSCAATDLIIESGREGKNSSQYKELLGKWMDSRIPPPMAKSPAPGLTPPGACTTRKTVFCGPNIITSGPAIARYSPQFTEKGHYYVYVTWPRGANASPVRYVVKYAGGQAKTKKLTQNGFGAGDSPCNAGTWVALGDYDFEPGDEQYVELHVESDVELLEPNWYGQAYADAVRFTDEPLKEPGVPMSAQSPPPWPGSEPPTVLASTPLNWNVDVQAAWREAKKAEKKIMLFFFSPDAYLDYYDKQLFVDPAVQAYIEAGYVPVRIDMQKEPELAQKLGVFRAGTIAVYNGEGNALGMVREPLSATEFVNTLQGF